MNFQYDEIQLQTTSKWMIKNNFNPKNLQLTPKCKFSQPTQGASQQLDVIVFVFDNVCGHTRWNAN